jgi:hypothetical protein
MASKRWSLRVTRESDALDLQAGVFAQRDPKRNAVRAARPAPIARRLLTFYINRAGKTLPKTQRTRLERAKVELRRQFGRE